MQIEDKIFRHKRIDADKLQEYGFRRAGNGEGFIFETDFLGGDFRAVINAGSSGITGSVIDNMSDEEYSPLRNVNYFGAFVGSVRQAYEELLTDIASRCCTDVLFTADQSNRIADTILERYGVTPDFPWDSDGNEDSGVFRHSDTSKWFGLIMNIRRDQLTKTSGKREQGKGKTVTASSHEGKTAEERVDVINLKKDMAKSEKLAAMKGVYPAFHMNHKLWISVVLDDTLTDEAVMELIDDSFRLTDKKKAAGISDEIIQRVLIIADSVPPGQVITYGQIAAEAGIPRNARLVGRIMSMADRYGDHPCHRVVGHDGRTVPGWKEQRLLLEAEGVTFLDNGRVNMYRHNIP